MNGLKKFKVIKVNMSDLPTVQDMDTLYFGISSQEGGVSAMCVDGKIWVSQEYIDNKLSELKDEIDQLKKSFNGGEANS